MRCRGAAPSAAAQKTPAAPEGPSWAMGRRSACPLDPHLGRKLRTFHDEPKLFGGPFCEGKDVRYGANGVRHEELGRSRLDHDGHGAIKHPGSLLPPLRLHPLVQHTRPLPVRPVLVLAQRSKVRLALSRVLFGYALTVARPILNLVEVAMIRDQRLVGFFVGPIAHDGPAVCS
jgi:hypothetical protein